ncbi:uncharacterized protein PRCAT00003982001 [Priceomyces carsonii]|uniref:uncharacterized protein n=1 Tax=Priceomyces carsonii TaxID=28549 RepID=UPI002ED87D6A|nr:unnamed protein product [Priceomyces carsonii]
MVKKLKVPNQERNGLNADQVAEPKYGKGVLREYLITTSLVPILAKRSIHSKEYFLIAILALSSWYVRATLLEVPNSVVFDEVHFGGYASKYILGQYFMDVHPPLAKMLFAAVGAFGGFKGDFKFEKIADLFPKSTPYVLMRTFPAVLGIGTVILAYLTLRCSGVRPWVAFITSGALIFENATITLSRYILLDSPLLFFIAAAAYSWKKFEIQIPFSFAWYKSLIACGIALGLSVSSKWVGLFTIAWVGVGCVFQLWFIIGDLTVDTRKIIKHFITRGVILLGIPAVCYIFFFAVHFNVLKNEGDGSPFMSSAFRSTLNGNAIPKNITANVGFGSVITIRHIETNGGYLHSHDHFYPTGSKQQQITLYPHLDSNNNWLIEPYNDTMPDKFVPIQDGTKVRLTHVNTKRRLHSHDEKPPVSERDWQKEVSCYGYEGFDGDANDDFIFEIVDYRSKNGDAQEVVKALNTVFRLKHAMTGTYLFSSEVKLPDWGFDQQEVTAASQGYRPLTHWYIETNSNSFIPEEEKEIVNYPVLSLWDKIVESHQKMWKINQGLTQHHNWQSSPPLWPLLLRGINYWVKDHRQVYLMGNAVIWWSSSLAIATFIIHALVSLVRWQCGAQIAKDRHVFNYNLQLFSYSLGWFLHYFPFFIMGRQLFLHHYIPAAYFAILALGQYFELFVGYFSSGSKALQKVIYAFLAIFVALNLLFYVHYSSIIYGTPWTRASCEASKALGTWDFDCNSFYTDIAQYQSFTPSSSTAPDSETQAAPVENQAEISEPKETPRGKINNDVREDLQSEVESPPPPKTLYKDEEETVPQEAVDNEDKT